LRQDQNNYPLNDKKNVRTQKFFLSKFQGILKYYIGLSFGLSWPLMDWAC